MLPKEIFGCSPQSPLLWVCDSLVVSNARKLKKKKICPNQFPASQLGKILSSSSSSSSSSSLLLLLLLLLLLSFFLFFFLSLFLFLFLLFIILILLIIIIINNMFIMKNLTYFLKTVETGTDPRPPLCTIF